MSIETASFLVSRGNQTYKCLGVDLDAKVQKSDLLCFQRGNTLYKADSGSITANDLIACTDVNDITYKVAGWQLIPLLPPTSLRTPTLSGTSLPGFKLYVNNKESGTEYYIWYRDGVEIPGETEDTYDTSEDDMYCDIGVKAFKRGMTSEMSNTITISRIELKEQRTFLAPERDNGDCATRYYSNMVTCSVPEFEGDVNQLTDITYELYVIDYQGNKRIIDCEEKNERLHSDNKAWTRCRQNPKCDDFTHGDVCYFVTSWMEQGHKVHGKPAASIEYTYHRSHNPSLKPNDPR